MAHEQEAEIKMVTSKGRSQMLGAAVNAAIIQAGFPSRAAAAKALGLTRASLNQVCNGAVSEENAQRICDALGFTLVITVVKTPKRR